MILKRRYGVKRALVLALCLMFSLAACGEKAPEFKFGSSEPLTLSDTDYSNTESWLRFGGDGRRDVDIFVIYPTVAMSMEDADRPYVRLGNELMRTSAAGWMMKVESFIDSDANIYAPFYRQLNGVEFDNLNSDTVEPYTNSTPREDIFAAFDYYLTNVNKGERPFILYGFSQGGQLVLELATTFLGNEKYVQHNENHIIAYAPGCSVTQSQIDRNPNLTFSQNADDTGVIVSWNTTAPSEIESEAYKNFVTWKQNALVTNPITWKTDETAAPAIPFAWEMMGPDGSISATGNADAAVDKERGVLVVSTVDESQYSTGFVPVSKYHEGDIMFFASSISQNIKDRIAAFNSK